MGQKPGALTFNLLTGSHSYILAETEKSWGKLKFQRLKLKESVPREKQNTRLINQEEGKQYQELEQTKEENGP